MFYIAGLENFGIMFGGLILLCVAAAVGIAVGALWIWTLIDCLRNEPDTGHTKVMWVLFVVLTFVLGAALYLVIRRPVRLVKYGR